jgi:hypothetical protein
MERNVAGLLGCTWGLIFAGLAACGESSSSSGALQTGGDSTMTGGGGDKMGAAGTETGSAGTDGSGGGSQAGSNGSGGASQAGSNGSGGASQAGSNGAGGGAAGDVSTDGGPVIGSDAGNGGGGKIKNVFIVLEENHNWSQVSALPYITHLQQLGAHSEQYYNPKGNHPSEPNYIWLEAGKNFCLTGANPCSTNDDDPTQNLVKGATHLSKLLDAAGVSWMSYQEDITAGQCPVSSGGGYQAKHNPFVFFDDVVGDPPSKTNAGCIAHHKPSSQFLTDLQKGDVARYNFITPNQDHDMHDGTPAAADAWLQMYIDPIINPLSPNHNAKIYAQSAVIVTWDEGSGGDGPIGMIIVSPYAKVGYKDTKSADYYYTHSSMLLTLQKIFGVAGTPIADAANAKDLSNFFIAFP